MSGPGKHDQSGFSKFDSMSTEELEEILRQDFLSEDGEENDLEMIIYISEVIAKRKRAESADSIPDVHKAWDSFQQNYLPSADGDSLYENENDESSANKKRAAKKTDVRSKRIHKIFRTVTVAASVFIVALSGSFIAASANGYDLWKVVAQWTKDTFGFGVESSRANSENSIQNSASPRELLKQYGIDGQYIPTWFPEGYEYAGTRVNELLECISLHIRYSNGQEEIIITISQLAEPYMSTFEKNDDLVEQYEMGGNDYYIFTNMEKTSILWISSECECSIHGSFTVDEAKKMINSMDKG